VMIPQEVMREKGMIMDGDLVGRILMIQDLTLMGIGEK
jgi:hypothetical protein